MDAGSDELKGQVVEVAALVAYQPGSVVSRTIMDKPAGTVTLFAFDAREGLSEHTAPFDALVTILDGQADVSIAGQPQRVRQGEMIILPAGEPHALRASGRFKMMLVMIRG